MRILMDDPETFAPFGRGAARAVAADGDERELWRRLAGEAAPAAAAAPPAAGDGFWRTGYLVAKAPASQYDALRALAAEGRLPAGNIFCLAGTGRGFHGQHGRTWRTLPGNLHLSAALAADLPVSGRGPALPALPAVAALDTVRRFAPAGGRAGIKWVNDVLLDGAKAGGVLTAVRTRDGRIERVFVGIGLNVATLPELPPDPFVPAVALLGGRGPAPELGAVATVLLAAIAARFTVLAAAGPDDLLRAYREGSLVMGRQVTVHPDEDGAGPPAAPRSGLVASIGPDLALHLEGDPVPVTGGRVVLDPR